LPLHSGWQQGQTPRRVINTPWQSIWTAYPRCKRPACAQPSGVAAVAPHPLPAALQHLLPHLCAHHTPVVAEAEPATQRAVPQPRCADRATLVQNSNIMRRTESVTEIPLRFWRLTQAQAQVQAQVQAQARAGRCSWPINSNSLTVPSSAASREGWRSSGRPCRAPMGGRAACTHKYEFKHKKLGIVVGRQLKLRSPATPAATAAPPSCCPHGHGKCTCLSERRVNTRARAFTPRPWGGSLTSPPPSATCAPGQGNP
jgi:hypothetical protein